MKNNHESELDRNEPMREMDWLYFMAQQRGYKSLADEISKDAAASEQRLRNIEDQIVDLNLNSERGPSEPQQNVVEMPVGRAEHAPWQFTLFVSGRRNSAFANLKEVLADRHPDEYVIRVVNIERNPGEAEREGVVFTPTVFASYAGGPRIEFVGDLSRIAEVRRQLTLHQQVAMMGANK